MGESIQTGTWVEISRIVLAAGQRAPQVPADTQQVPLEMKVRGFLVVPASLGEAAEIRTLSGRRLSGTLTAVEPAYRQGFGTPISEISTISEEVRTILHK